MTQPPEPGVTPDETPADRRRKRVHDRIIQAAEELFAREGAAGLSMRRLAQQIDYSPAAIYTYFASKDDLIDEIREQFFERLLLRLDDVVTRLGAERCVKPCLRTYIECALERPNHYRMAFEICDKPEDHGQNAYKAAKMLEGLIAENIASGRFRCCPLNLIAASVWSALHGLAILLADEHFLGWPDEGEGLELNAIIDVHVGMIERGLLTNMEDDDETASS